jgi:hypothetical protein
LVLNAQAFWKLSLQVPNGAFLEKNRNAGHKRCIAKPEGEKRPIEVISSEVISRSHTGVFRSKGSASAKSGLFCDWGDNMIGNVEGKNYTVDEHERTFLTQASLTYSN